MNWSDTLSALLGGVLIGLSATVMLLAHGRIAGISGILGGVLTSKFDFEVRWRWLFLAGLLLGGAALYAITPLAFEITVERSNAAVVAAGLLVGFGSRLGSGCTSGHGVCGISRLSPRSLVATGTFMTTGAIVVYVVSKFFGGVL